MANRDRDEDLDDELQLEHRTDRDILILALREIRDLRGLHPRVRSLETWRTGLTAAWGAVVGAGVIAVKLFNITPKGHQ